LFSDSFDFALLKQCCVKGGAMVGAVADGVNRSEHFTEEWREEVSSRDYGQCLAAMKVANWLSGTVVWPLLYSSQISDLHQIERPTWVLPRNSPRLITFNRCLARLSVNVIGRRVKPMPFDS
jgi:hypothetical protein